MLRVPSLTCVPSERAPSIIVSASNATGTINAARKNNVQRTAASFPRPPRAPRSFRYAGYEAIAITMPHVTRGRKGRTMNRQAVVRRTSRPTWIATSRARRMNSLLLVDGCSVVTAESSTEIRARLVSGDCYGERATQFRIRTVFAPKRNSLFCRAKGECASRGNTFFSSKS